MQYTEIKPNVWHVTFETQYELASAFLPFQEYYENIYFCDSTFTMSQFKEWYKEKFGSFSYHEDWTGFNIPTSIMNSFTKSQTLVELAKETSESAQLFHFLCNLNSSSYVIGTISGENPEALEHEMAHARYAVDECYRNAVNRTLEANEEFLGALRIYLLDLSYHPKVITDEVHAYILTEESYLLDKGLWNLNLSAIRSKIKERIW